VQDCAGAVRHFLRGGGGRDPTQPTFAPYIFTEMYRTSHRLSSVARRNNKSSPLVNPLAHTMTPFTNLFGLTPNPASSMMPNMLPAFLQSPFEMAMAASSTLKMCVSHETEKEITYQIEVPGMAAKNLSVQVDNTGWVSIEATHKNQTAPLGDFSYTRSKYFNLPLTVGASDMEKGTATLSRGILSLTFSKGLEDGAKKITKLDVLEIKEDEKLPQQSPP